jgi:PAS domain S-box-containing protein
MGEKTPGYRLVPGKSLNSIFRSPPLRQALGFCLFATAFYFAFQFGMSFSPACASPFWFPDSVLLCALLLSRPRNWWVFVLAPLPIRLFSPIVHDLPTWFLLANFANDSAKGLLVAVALRRFLRNPTRVETVREFVLFCFFAVVLAPAASAFVGAAAHHACGRDYWTAWQQWFMGDALTHLVVTPAILYWLVGALSELRMPSRKRCLEGGLLAAGLILTGYLAFNADANVTSLGEWRFYAPVPLLFWAAIRFEMFGASGAIAVITFFSVAAAIHSRGPFWEQSPEDTALTLQQFLLLRAAPLYLVAILIQQRRDGERSLRESEERFRIMADMAPVLIWMAGTNKLCEFFNRGWLDFTGRTMEQELGNGWAQGVHPSDMEHCLKTYQAYFDARRPFELEYRLRRHDGEYRWIIDRGVPRYAASGDFVGYIGTAIDITDRKLAEEARQELMHASRMATMGEFTAIIAHELSKPLSAILTNTEAAESLLDFETVPLDELGRILADIHQDGLRARETIRRIRFLLRKREVEMQPLDMNETVSEALRLASGDATRRHVQICNECHVPLPTVRGDSVHLQQVILNLILNGMDAMRDTPESERRLSVSTDSKTDGYVEVAVKDVGHGIPSENLSRIFDSFFTTKRHGLGIGLAISRSIVQMHSGRLWAENNQDGKGTTFRFVVPAAVVTSPREAIPAGK